MNKHLLLGSALLAALSVYPQVHRAKPTGYAIPVIKEYPAEKVGQNHVTNSNNQTPGPVKQVKGNANAKTTAITDMRFSGSQNALGVYVTESNSLTYNEDLGLVNFVHRAGPQYNSVGGNSGTIVSKYTSNNGTSWDSTVMWMNNTNLARYPQGGIYNPSGNTNISNAYVVGMGPITTGGWTGNWYASKQLSIPGTNTPGADQQSIMNNTMTATSNPSTHHFSRMSFQATDDGFVRSVAQIENDVNGTTYATIGYRGAGIVKGVFSAGGFVWTMDSVIPGSAVMTNTAGGYPYMDINAIQAWSESGQIGYVVFYGVRSGEMSSDPCNCRVNAKGGWQPIVYKTTNSGVSWSLLPAEDFTAPKFQGVSDRLYAVTAPSGTIIPYFTTNESRDATVDMNGNLHLVTTVTQHYSDHVDSLGYVYQFGTEKYGWGHTGSFDHPIIYDFYTQSSGGWWYHMVDSMGTEGPSGGTTTTNAGWNSNPWTDASTAGNKPYLDARIQISRTADGKRIYYSWTESDSTFTAPTKWNIFPDINMRGYDVTTDMVTPRLGNVNGTTPTYTSVTTGLTNTDASAYFHYMSDKAIGSGSGATNSVPFTATKNSGLDAGVAVAHYYIGGVDVASTSFTITPMRPTGVNSAVSSVSSTDVFNYPNPATESTTIFVNLKDAKVLDITLYNTVGQLVKTINVNGQKGDNQITLDVRGLSKGVYIYNVKTNNGMVSKKLIVE
jgi:hypothetical protein